MSGVKVGIVMGSASDLDTLQPAKTLLEEFGIGCELRVLSAHRTPDQVIEYTREAKGRGIEVLIAGAGGAAALPGMIAGLTPLPVLGVPVQSKALQGLDSLLSIVQMPGGVPTATFSIGRAGATNAALFAARILALGTPELQEKLEGHRRSQEAKVLASDEKIQAEV
jgi:5-(carboxyamino)imidazole ribonucleotide mutase